MTHISEKMRKVLALLGLLGSWAIAGAEPFEKDLVDAAIERTHHQVRYDGSYRKIGYPLGDVPDEVGVCTDLVIRAYRALGVDLQQLVHQDMARHFAEYPKLWGLTRPDPNIDHRRVPNLQRFLERNGEVLPPSQVADDYGPGELVTWMLPGNRPHIGIVTDRRASGSGRPMIAHNIGWGPQLEDMLFAYRITGHYKYVGPDAQGSSPLAARGTD